MVDLGQSLHDGLAPQNGQPVMQGSRGVGRQDGLRAHQQHVARVQAGIHLHDGDAGLRVTRLDGPVNGGRAAPARQQGGVNVQAALGWQVEHPLRQDQPISGHNHGLGVCGQKRLAGGRSIFGVFAIEAQTARLGHGHTVLKGPLLDGRGLQLHAATSGAVGLGQHQNDVVAGSVQGAHGQLGKFGRARKNQSHAVLSARLFGL